MLRRQTKGEAAGLRARCFCWASQARSPVELDAGILALWLADAVLAARLKWDNKLDQAA
jgi:hypothetical protein